MDEATLKRVVREAIAEELGPRRLPPMAPKWRDGTLVLRPGADRAKGKEIPIEVLLKKVTSVRDRLRVLEQKLNADKELSPENRADYQLLITRAYGSLTSFNLLFLDDDDRFVGVGGLE